MATTTVQISSRGGNSNYVTAYFNVDAVSIAAIDDREPCDCTEAAR